MITDQARRRFDRLLEQVLAQLPDNIHEMLEEVPLIVEDEPSPRLLADLDRDDDDFGPGDDLCGLHWGVALTHRSVEHSSGGPDQIYLFRGPIMRLARRDRDDLKRQIRITLLHEVGHHFGLDEGDLEALGYG